jgi:hypothetical protein
LRPVRSWVRTGTRRAEDRRSRGRRHAMCEPTRRPHRALARGHSLRVLAAYASYCGTVPVKDFTCANCGGTDEPAHWPGPDGDVATNTTPGPATTSDSRPCSHIRNDLRLEY